MDHRTTSPENIVPYCLISGGPDGAKLTVESFRKIEHSWKNLGLPVVVHGVYSSYSFGKKI